MIFVQLNWVFKETVCYSSKEILQNVGDTGARAAIKLTPMGEGKRIKSFHFYCCIMTLEISELFHMRVSICMSACI